MPDNTSTPAKTVDAAQFAALCNLFCLLQCNGADELTAEQIGDTLLYGAHRVACDHSRLMARAVLAYLGFRTGIPGGGRDYLRGSRRHAERRGITGRGWR